MNFDTVYTTLLKSIQDIAQEDDRVSEDDFIDIVEELSKLKSMLVK